MSFELSTTRGIRGPYVGVTVAVNAWTLVAISLERYYAVCEPLKSRGWQTASHAWRVVLFVWIASFSIMGPVAWVSKLMPTRPPSAGKFKCREKWPSGIWESAFNIFLDASLLAIPLLIMATAYCRIAIVLRREIPGNHFSERIEPGLQEDTDPSANGPNGIASGEDDCIACKSPKIAVKWTKVKMQGRHEGASRTSTVNLGFQSLRHHSSGADMSNTSVTRNMNTHNLERRLAIKKRVIWMLFVVVLEFFICWTPIYVINTISTFDPNFVYKKLGYFTISVFHLLSYISSCCNPVTYCFMNKNFRREFLQTFTRLCFLLKDSKEKPNNRN